MSDGVKHIESLNLYARIIQNNGHHADAKRQVHQKIMPEIVGGVLPEMKMQNRKHCSQEPASNIRTSPGKAKQMQGGNQRAQTPQNRKDSIQRLEMREPHSVNYDQHQSGAQDDSGGKDKSLLVSVQQDGTGEQTYCQQKSMPTPVR